MESVKAHVEHEEFVGSAAAGCREGLAPLRDLAERHGVDVAAWMPVGIELSTGEYGYRKLTLLAVSRRDAGRDEEGLDRYLARSGGHPAVMKFVVEAPVEEFLGLFTKLDLVLLQRRLHGVEAVEVVEAAALRD